jgi:hypothetical protein
MSPALKGGLLEHRAEIIDLYQRREARIAAVAIVVRLYEGLWPLDLSTLCRALVASRHPLRTMPVIEFLDHLDGITPGVRGLGPRNSCARAPGWRDPAESVTLP